ncbi:MAG: hypothetical protein ABSA79_05005 [Candidatus Bathyarchaeia archaeon]|jgi:hypothetical protein
MKKLQILIIEFLISLSTCVFAGLQAKAFNASSTGGMSLTSAKGLTVEVKE